jgi:hypothetical protein
MYIQSDPRWANLKINGTNSTLGSYGCFIMCLSWLSEKEPPEALKLLEKGGAFKGDLIITEKACEVLGLNYDPPARSEHFNPSIECVVEVYLSVRYPQHFCIWNGDGTILDPIDGKKKKNPYRIISFRLITKKQKMENHIVTEIMRRAKKYLGVDAGSRINESEDKKIGDAIRELVRQKENAEAIIEETRKELFKLNDKFNSVQNLLGEVIATKEEMEIELKEVYRENVKLLEEISKLHNIQDQNTDVKAMDALAYFFRVLISKVKR